MKKITLKIDFELPINYKYIAQDSDGELIAYIEEPKIDDDCEYFYCGSSSYITLAHGAPNQNWRESLSEI
jgi:hypothetical protein